MKLQLKSLLKVMAMLKILEISLTEITPVVITAVFGIIATWITAATQKKWARENQLIDQLQEERENSQKEIAALKKEISEIKERKALMQKSVEENHETFQQHMNKIHSLLEHVWKLEQHIIKELPPPPPKMDSDI